MPDTVKAKVIGPCAIEGVATGGTVELDPERVNIDALVEGGHIEITKGSARTAEKTGEGGR